jgi:hypothetical protein
MALERVEVIGRRRARLTFRADMARACGDGA